jgi:hypothetical protein
MNKDLPSSPNPFSQIWEKRSETFKVPLPGYKLSVIRRQRSEKGSETFKVPLSDLGEGFRVRAKTTVLNLDEVYNNFKISLVFKR